MYVCIENNATSDNCQHGTIQLERGFVDYEGTVNICYNNLWTTICDSGWSDSDARVACTQAGYPGPGEGCTIRSNVFKLIDFAFIAALSRQNSYFGVESSFMLLSGVTCSGVETSLLDCGYTILPYWWCGQYDIAGVMCDGLYALCYLPSAYM